MNTFFSKTFSRIKQVLKAENLHILKCDSGFIIRQQNLELKQQIAKQKSLVEFADHVSNTSSLLTISQFAKIVNNKQIPMGQNRMFRWLRSSGYLRQNNEPYQSFIDRGFFKQRELIRKDQFRSKTYIQTYITGKGQLHLFKELQHEFCVAF